MSPLDALFAGFRWYRRLRGGHWERWWVDPPVASDVWIQNPHGRRPGLCYGTPICEDYTTPRLGAHPYRGRPS